MRYMRIPQNKFWGWVVFSVLFGLAVGLGIMLWRTSALSDRITVLQHQVQAAGGSSSTLTSVQSQLAAAEASVTALTAQNANLQAQLSSGGSSSTTPPSTTTTAALVVVSRTISPSTVATSGTITMTAKVKGSPTKVTMRLYNASKSFDKTYSLKKSSTSGGTQTWKLAVSAPTIAGTYRYFATAIKGSTRVTMVGASPAKLTVR